ncbi:hypothetical protein PMAYCL1PPCAC_09675, partial [Pristionchus mayeri]
MVIGMIMLGYPSLSQLLIHGASISSALHAAGSLLQTAEAEESEGEAHDAQHDHDHDARRVVLDGDEAALIATASRLRLRYGMAGMARLPRLSGIGWRVGHEK